VILGATILFDTDIPGLEVSRALLGAIAFAALAFSLVVARLAFTSRLRRVATGAEQMIGISGKVESWMGLTGYVIAHGERWKAVSAEPLVAGDPVSVTGRNGLALEVASRPKDT
jgi:membrane-bound serine protease (ClpP class)